MRLARFASALLLASAAPLAAAADPVAGSVELIAGSVTSTAPAGSVRALVKDDFFYSGDRITTGPASYVRLTFLDGSAVVLRPDTVFAVERFRFAGEPPLQVVTPPPTASLQVTAAAGGGNEALLRLVRGGFRAVTGLIGKVNRQEYAVRTPVATIGIRGTTFLSVTCDMICAADQTVQASLPAGDSAVGGTISAVDQGGIVLNSISEKVASLDATQVLLTTASGTHVTLPVLPAFLGGESWMSAAQQAALPEPAAATGTGATTLPASSVAVTPVAAAAAIAIGAGVVILASDMEDGSSASTSTPTTPSTATAR